MVGGCGFIVNYLMLALFFDLLGLPILAAQIIGAETALLATFIGNNYWAFGGHHKVRKRVKLLKFHISAFMGLLINSTCVVLLVELAHVYYGLALVTGSLAGMVWNYTLYKKFVFRAYKDHKSPDKLLEEEQG